MRIFYSGINALVEVDRLCQRSDWVALGSFGLRLECGFLDHLPKDSQLIVGLPDEAGPASTQILKLRILKKKRPDLLILARTGFHAKYGLFRGKQRSFTMCGSMNLTVSPAEEVVVFQEDPGLFRAVAEIHGRWLRLGNPVEPYEAQQLSPTDLAALSSKTVRR